MKKSAEKDRRCQYQPHVAEPCQVAFALLTMLNSAV
jgi:hypothetical protein